MRTIAAGTALAPLNGWLVFFHAPPSGHLSDPFDLQFIVYRTASDEELLSPVQVFPPVEGVRAEVDLVADRIGKGRYSASGWTPAGTGKHFVRWFWTSEDGDAERSGDTPFDVQAFAVDPSVPFYGSLSDAREQGVAACDASDAKVMAALRRASRFIEAVTGRWFEPRYTEVFHDGRGSSALLLMAPVIALDTLRVTTRPIRPADLALDPDYIRVYNRHLSGLTSPDDRNNPRIELYSGEDDWVGVRPFSFSRLVFPRAQQNVHVASVSGYTDPDGTPFGRTPEDIDFAALLIMLRNLPTLMSAERTDAINRGRVKSEGTRDQNYTLMTPAELGLASNVTGDPEIDQILARFMRPPMMGAA